MDKRLINASKIDIPSKEYFEQATLTIDTLFKTYDQELVALDQVLVNRIANTSSEKTWVIIISISGFLITHYLMVALYLAIVESISKIQTASTQLAKGDLTVSADLTSKDEMLYIANSSDNLYSNVEETNHTNSLDWGNDS